MRRAKLGDAYAVKVPNGYKIIQWAYHIPKYGRFIRVFDGLYDTVPENIAEIVAGPHSYIAGLFVGRAYRIGLLDWLGNYSVPAEYPTPEYQIDFCRDQYHQIYQIRIQKTPIAEGLPRFFTFPVSTIAELPEPYRDVKLLHACVSPDWLLYLFDNDFTLNNPDRFEPWLHWGENWREKFQVYIDMVETALEKDRANRRKPSTP